MFSWFKKDADQRSKLEKKYRQLLEESYKLSHSNRTLADQKMAEANKIAEELAQLNKEKAA